MGFIRTQADTFYLPQCGTIVVGPCGISAKVRRWSLFTASAISGLDLPANQPILPMSSTNAHLYGIYTHSSRYFLPATMRDNCCGSMWDHGHMMNHQCAGVCSRRAQFPVWICLLTSPFCQCPRQMRKLLIQ
jgi:hypothetical protein